MELTANLLEQIRAKNQLLKNLTPDESEKILIEVVLKLEAYAEG